MQILEKSKYNLVSPQLAKVSINNLFARSVVEHKVDGTVYVNDSQNPKTFLVVHPYGISLLFGDNTNNEFNAWFRAYALNENKARKSFQWMQAYPAVWHTTIKSLFGEKLIGEVQNIKKIEDGIIEQNTRVNFKFSTSKYQKLEPIVIPDNAKVVATDAKAFCEMKGAVIPAYFWNSAKDFCESGVGFSLYADKEIAATAYAAFIHDDKLEIGIETVEKFRGRGFAVLVSRAIINYCLEKHLEPVWACKKENVPSYKLAQKLGFEPVLELPYYRLSR